MIRPGAHWVRLLGTERKTPTETGQTGGRSLAGGSQSLLMAAIILYSAYNLLLYIRA